MAVREMLMSCWLCEDAIFVQTLGAKATAQSELSEYVMAYFAVVWNIVITSLFFSYQIFELHKSTWSENNVVFRVLSKQLLSPTRKYWKLNRCWQTFASAPESQENNCWSSRSSYPKNDSITWLKTILSEACEKLPSQFGMKNESRRFSLSVESWQM